MKEETDQSDSVKIMNWNIKNGVQDEDSYDIYKESFQFQWKSKKQKRNEKIDDILREN